MNEMRCPLNTLAEILPDSPAIIRSNNTVIFSELEKLVHYTAVNLKDSGLERYSHIAILGNNSIEYCILILAALRIGAIICPINNRWPKKTIIDTLNRLECYVLIKMSDVKDFELDEIESLDVDEVVPKTIDRKLVYGQPVISVDNPATIIFTSGSTSTPKAALLSYGNLFYNATGANKRIPFDENHRWLLSLPLYHVGGLGILFRSIVGGGAVVIPEKEESHVEAIDKYEITHLSLVSTQLFRLVHDNALNSLKCHPIALIGGGPVAESLVNNARRAGLKIYTTYGLTEMASQVTTDKCLNGLHSGKILNGRELKIADDGEILVRGKTLFLGYVENDEAVLHLDADGWFQTGDIGELDAEGNLQFQGRKDNMFICGGENIYPEEIESQIMQINGIEQALVVAISDDEFVQRPLAFIRSITEGRLDDNKIKAELHRTLPKYKIPKTYLNWPDKSKSNTLKPNREEFTALAENLLANSAKQSPRVSS